MTLGSQWPGHGRPLPRQPGRRARRRRGRYVIWSAMSIVVVGVGAAAFGMGGSSSGGNEPQITPQLEVFDMQHAITSGDVPFADPSSTRRRRRPRRRSGASLRASPAGRSGGDQAVRRRPGLLVSAVVTVTIPGVLAVLAILGHEHAVAGTEAMSATALADGSDRRPAPDGAGQHRPGGAQLGRRGPANVGLAGHGLQRRGRQPAGVRDGPARPGRGGRPGQRPTRASS